MTALSDVYKEEDNRELPAMAPLGLEERSITDDFTAMVYAQWLMYKRVTGDDIDILGFTHIVNRLVVQKLIGDKARDGR